MKRKQGRPKLPKAERRSFRLPLRIKESEADKLMEQAQASGMTFTNFLRARLLG